MTSRKTQPGFNELLAELEGIVQHLESDKITLEASMTAFERGIALARSAQQLLSGAEQRVLQLTESPEGKLQSAPFHDDEETQ